MLKKLILAAAFCLVPLSFAVAAPSGGLYAYETAEGMPVGAVFGTLPNVGKGDELLGAKSPVCDRIEMHNMSETDGIMQMRKAASIPLNDADTVLGPQGYHLMLLKLTKPLKVGESFTLTLTFKKAGDQEVVVPVLARGTASAEPTSAPVTPPQTK